MNATERLRELLDERGVEYVAEDEPSVGLHFTSWDADGFMWEADDRDKRIYLSADRLITPKQAIAATLGAGTCKADETETIKCVAADGSHLTVHVMECSACGHTYEHVNGDYEYCPHCGRCVSE